MEGWKNDQSRKYELENDNCEGIFNENKHETIRW